MMFLAVLMPYLLQLPGYIWLDALGVLQYLGIILMLNLGYDGYLSIQTGIMRNKSSLMLGRYAVVGGVIQVGLSIFGLVFLYLIFKT